VAKLRLTIIDEVSNRRLKVDLPDDVAVEKLLPALAEKLGLPTIAPGGLPIAYQWTHETTGRTLSGDYTLALFGVREGDALKLAMAREEAPTITRPAVEQVDLAEEEIVPLGRKVPVWGWIGIGIGGAVFLAAAVATLVFLAGRVGKPEPTPTAIAEVTTPAATSTVVPQPTDTPIAPTATPVPPTSTPIPPTATLEVVVMLATPTPEEPTATLEPTATPALPTATPAPPTATPVVHTPTKTVVLAGKLAYTVYNMDLEYLETIVVTVDGTYVLSVPSAIQPAFSSDGKWLVFRSLDPAGVGVMNLDTGARQTLTGVAQDSHPSFNPESHDIVFSRDDRLYLVDVVSQPTVREVGDSALIHVGIAAGRFPDWCRVAHKTPGIVYSGFAEGGGFGLMLTTPVYDVHYAITQELGDLMPTWSPDCTQIAFAREDGGNWDIYMINPDGSGRSHLTSDGAIEFAPAWSPAGDLIAFLSNREGRWAIWVMDPKGRNPRRLIEIEDRIHTFQNPLEQSIDWAP
jgi:hypothetical protein